MSLVDTPAIDMTEMVRVKERELHEIHELRCHQLENMIDDRDKLISDAAKRFGLLKDDFQYNLTLLEARDAEISRLSSLEGALRNELEEIEAEKLALSNRLNEILKKDVDRGKKHKIDRERTKKMLSELQQELESLKWSTADDINCKVREVEGLKKDLRRVQQERDDALESQRAELVHTYDKLLQGREKEFAVQEEHIAEQVHGLEQRFQHLTTENARLKSELSSALRDIDKMSVQSAAAEERCLEMEWRLSDRERNRVEVEEELVRKLHAAESELLVARQEGDQLSSDHKREIEKLKAEAKRDKEYAALQLRHLDEAHQKITEDADSLRTQLTESESREALAKRETDMWRERANRLELREAQLTERFSALQESTGGELRKSEAEISTLHNDLDQLHAKHREVCTTLQQTEQSLKETRESSAQKLMEARNQLLEATRHFEQMTAAEVANARAEAEANFITSHSESDASLHVEVESLRQQIKEKMMAIEELQDALAARTRECEEERMESDALRLRLRLHGANTDGGPGAKSSGQFAESRTLLDLQQPQGMVVPSPMFSEDMGPVSIPASPASSPIAKHLINRRPNKPLPGSDEYKFGADSPEVEPGGRATGVAVLEPGDMEMRRLKASIREMRRDAEELQIEMRQVADERDAAEARASELEDRLHMAAAEVNRLRQERRRLMDVSNELRAVIHKLRSADVQPPASSDAPPSAPSRGDDDNRDEPAESSEDVANMENGGKNASARLQAGGVASQAKPKRATDRETASQQAALQRIKSRQFGRLGSVGGGLNHGTDGAPRKVVNYANSDNFE